MAAAKNSLTEIDVLIVVVAVVVALYVGFWGCMASGFELAVGSAVDSPTNRFGLAMGLLWFVSGPFVGTAAGAGIIFYGSRALPGATPMLGRSGSPEDETAAARSVVGPA